jgi:hypothetical protein
MFHVDKKRATESNSRLVLTEGQSAYRPGGSSLIRKNYRKTSISTYMRPADFSPMK